MFLFTKNAEQVTPEDALPGRESPMQVPERHEVLGTPLQPPFPEGIEQLVVGTMVLVAFLVWTKRKEDELERRAELEVGGSVAEELGAVEDGH